ASFGKAAPEPSRNILQPAVAQVAGGNLTHSCVPIVHLHADCHLRTQTVPPVPVDKVVEVDEGNHKSPLPTADAPRSLQANHPVTCALVLRESIPAIVR